MNHRADNGFIIKLATCFKEETGKADEDSLKAFLVT